MKKIVVALLACLTAFVLCGCQVKCGIDGCGKKVEKAEENKIITGKYLCDEHMEQFEKDVKESGFDSAEEWYESTKDKI